MIFNQRHLFIYRDWISFFLIILLACIGLLFIFSSTYRPDKPFSLFFIKQSLGLLVGCGIYFGVSCIDYRALLRWGYGTYFCVIGLLVFTIFKGSVGMGGQRWIHLFFFKLQTSELAKLFFPAYATYRLYDDPTKEKPTFNAYANVLIMLAISFLLIRKQPDLGTALIVLFSGLIMVWIAGIDKRFFIISFLIITTSAPISWHFLKDYQKKRILVFLGYGEHRKERYQIEQSKIAIGSGGLYGKGFLRGTQTQLNFLPESRTDFIFSVIAEEWGLLGAVTVVMLFILLFLRLLSIAATIQEPSIQLLALGLIIPIMLSTFINICMVIGLLPVVGIPLPFISYGLSNLWTTLASLGWFQSIALHRFRLKKNSSSTAKKNSYI
jgi:rod shape determining protein RodA